MYKLQTKNRFLVWQLIKIVFHQGILQVLKLFLDHPKVWWLL